MEISEKEYAELKEQIRVLQEKVGGFENKPTREIKSLVNELPISHVRNTDESYPDFGFSTLNADVWKTFTDLAKAIHAPSYKFYLGVAYADGLGTKLKPYIRTTGDHNPPRKITDMTNEQIEISVSMLNELIPIYNKYFRMLHQEVLYCDNKEGVYRKIAVEKVEEE